MGNHQQGDDIEGQFRLDTDLPEKPLSVLRTEVTAENIVIVEVPKYPDIEKYPFERIVYRDRPPVQEPPATKARTQRGSPMTPPSAHNPNPPGYHWDSGRGRYIPQHQFDRESTNFLIFLAAGIGLMLFLLIFASSPH